MSFRQRSFTITGHFDDAECQKFFADLAALMRAVEQKHLEEDYFLTLDDPMATMADAEKSVKDAFGGEPPFMAKIEFGKKE